MSNWNRIAFDTWRFLFCFDSLNPPYKRHSLPTIELLNNNSHGLLPPGGFVSLLCDQVLHFASIKLYQASWMWYHFSCHHVTVFVVVQLNCIFNTEKNLVYTSTQKRNNCGAGISNFNTDEFSWTAGNLTSGTRALVLVENPFPRLTPWRSCILY